LAAAAAAARAAALTSLSLGPKIPARLALTAGLVGAIYAALALTTEADAFWTVGSGAKHSQAVSLGTGHLAWGYAGWLYPPAIRSAISTSSCGSFPAVLLPAEPSRRALLFLVPVRFSALSRPHSAPSASAGCR